MTKVQDAPGGLKMKIAAVESDMKLRIVMYMELPEGTLKAVPTKTLLDGIEGGAVAKSGGKKVSSKELTFKSGGDTLPGREVLVEKDGNLVRTHVIVADPKVFVIVVGGPKDFATGPDASAFLKSFEIARSPNGKTGD